MPIHLKPLDVSTQLGDVRSVLIVSCPICPPMSLAMQTASPFMELLKSGLKTGAFENHIRSIRAALEQRGIRTGVYCSYLPCPTMCLWTQGQRRRFLQRAKRYEAVLVLGCCSATETVNQTLEGCGCRVVQAMQATGIANATLGLRSPATLDFRDTTYVGGPESIENRGSPSAKPDACASRANRS